MAAALFTTPRSYLSDATLRLTTRLLHSQGPGASHFALFNGSNFAPHQNSTCHLHATGASRTMPCQWTWLKSLPSLHSTSLCASNPYTPDISLRHLPKGAARRKAEVQIWRIAVVPDRSVEGGPSTGLSASKLASFPLDPEITLFESISLSGPLLAFAARWVQRYRGCKNDGFVTVFNWKNIPQPQNSIGYPRRCFASGWNFSGSAMHLLSGKFIICASSERVVALYDYSSLPLVRNFPRPLKPSQWPGLTLPALWERYFDLRAGMFSTPQLCGGHRFFNLISATEVDPCGVGLFVYDQKQVPKNEQRVDVVQLTSRRFYPFAVGSHATLIKWKECQQWRSLIRCAHSMAPKIWRGAEPFMVLDESSGWMFFSDGSPQRKQKVVDFSLFPV
ncbi:hypothetical protein BDZ97DRAFT_2059120 [Flammula alnicola]|nr:hypothetical protein BDZ97DRAFT_2059120 [Flammula alnicola]